MLRNLLKNGARSRIRTNDRLITNQDGNQENSKSYVDFAKYNDKDAYLNNQVTLVKFGGIFGSFDIRELSLKWYLLAFLLFSLWSLSACGTRCGV